jgi:hypothetical protein
MRRLIGAVAVALSLPAATPAAQQGSVEPNRQRDRASEERRAALGSLAVAENVLPGDVVATIRQGLQDIDPAIRAQALLTLSGRTGGLRFRDTPSRRES